MPDPLIPASPEAQSPIVTDSVESSQAPTTPAPHQVALESKVEKALAELQMAALPSPPAADTVVQPEAEPIVAADPVTGAAEPDGSPTLPDAHQRSLLANGYSVEDIKQGLEVHGSAFRETAAKMHESRVQNSREWANLGRAKKAEAAAATAEAPKPMDIGSLKPIDAQEFTEKYGEEAGIMDIVNSNNQMIQMLQSSLPELQQAQQYVQQTRDAQIGRAIDGFFGGDDMKPYAELYGNDNATASQDQADKRMEVLQLADAMQMGAAEQGRDLTDQEAMQHAHFATNQDFLANAARAELQGLVTARSKGVSQKPSTRQPSPVTAPSDRPLTQQESENRIAARLRAIKSN